MTWEKPPPVTVVSGDLEYYRLREVKKAIKAAEKKGRRVVLLTAEDKNGLSISLSSNIFFTEKTLVVIECAVGKKSSEPDAEQIERHWKEGDSDIAIVVHVQGAIPAGWGDLKKIAKSLGKLHIDFPEPKPWEVRPRASAFLVAEMKRAGWVLPESMSAEIVRMVGVDYGLLAFEVDKYSRLLTAKGKPPGYTVSPPDILGVVSRVGMLSEDIGLLVDAVGARDFRKVIRLVEDVREGMDEGEMVGVCRLLTYHILKWLHVVVLRESGMDDATVAACIEMHPYAYQKNLLPIVARWKSPRLTELLRGIVLADRKARLGAISPWVLLEAVLIEACLSPSTF